MKYAHFVSCVILLYGTIIAGAALGVRDAKVKLEDEKYLRYRRVLTVHGGEEAVAKVLLDKLKADKIPKNLLSGKVRWSPATDVKAGEFQWYHRTLDGKDIWFNYEFEQQELSRPRAWAICYDGFIVSDGHKGVFVIDAVWEVIKGDLKGE